MFVNGTSNIAHIVFFSAKNELCKLYSPANMIGMVVQKNRKWSSEQNGMHGI